LAEQPPETPGALARLRDARLHMIGAEEEFRALPGGSGLDARWVFLQKMQGLGHSAADRWLGANLASVGVHSTVDLRELARPSLGPHAGEDGQPRLGV
jgi:NTE family protein